MNAVSRGPKNQKFKL